MGPNKTTEHKLIAAKIDAFRLAAEWIPGIKIIQSRNPSENLFICTRGLEKYKLTENFFRHLPCHEFKKLIFDPKATHTCLIGGREADENIPPTKEFFIRQDPLNEEQEMELIIVHHLLPDSLGIARYFFIQIIPLSFQSWAAPKTKRIAEEIAFCKKNKEKFSQLTDRNKQVLSLMGRCQKAEEIGEELNIGVNTVNSHKKRIKELLDTNETWDLVQYGFAFDLV